MLPKLNTRNEYSMAVERKRYESPIFTLALFVIIFLGLIAIPLDPTGSAASNGGVIDAESLKGIHGVLFAIGLVMVLVGVAIRFIALATLRRNFSGALRIRADHTLVRHGIYRRIRHPAYLGAIVLLVGIPVMLSSLLGILVMLLLIPYLLHRIKLEERMMIERFGKEYEDYIHSTKRLIPFIY
jgi:protein-S-isoprenylcysteine O-methyltransferase Ste14